MERKTCGDCIFYHGIHDDCGVCTLSETDETFDKTCDFVYSCKNFEPKQPPTNGDRVQQLSNDDLAEFFTELKCGKCIYYDRKNYGACKAPQDKSCVDGIEEWLNAPAESEVESE